MALIKVNMMEAENTFSLLYSRTSYYTQQGFMFLTPEFSGTRHSAVLPFVMSPTGHRKKEVWSCSSLKTPKPGVKVQ